jgi:hypothetical protein
MHPVKGINMIDGFATHCNAAHDQIVVSKCATLAASQGLRDTGSVSYINKQIQSSAGYKTHCHKNQTEVQYRMAEMCPEALVAGYSR